MAEPDRETTQPAESMQCANVRAGVASAVGTCSVLNKGRAVVEGVALSAALRTNPRFLSVGAEIVQSDTRLTIARLVKRWTEKGAFVGWEFDGAYLEECG